jgi:hypothetical protein
MAEKKVLKVDNLTLEAERAQRGLRWAVGAPDAPRSATWRLWGNKKGDIYLAVRSKGGQQHRFFFDLAWD